MIHNEARGYPGGYPRISERSAGSHFSDSAYEHGIPVTGIRGYPTDIHNKNCDFNSTQNGTTSLAAEARAVAILSTIKNILFCFGVLFFNVSAPLNAPWGGDDLCRGQCEKLIGRVSCFPEFN